MAATEMPSFGLNAASEDLLVWEPGELRVEIEIPEDRPATIRRISFGPTVVAGGAGSPLAEPLVLGHGRDLNQTRGLARTRVGARLRPRREACSVSQDRTSVAVVQVDGATGLEVRTELTADASARVVRAVTTAVNGGTAPLVLEALPSLMLDALGQADPASVRIWRGASSWCAENRWVGESLAGNRGVIRNDTAEMPLVQSAAVTAVGRSTWSTDGDLPVGVLVDEAGGRALGWQIEHNGPWRWEVGGSSSAPFAVSVGLSGPTWEDHQWAIELPPGGSFTTVPVAVGVGSDLPDVVSQLAAYRRARRRPRPGESRPYLVFNDYMNTLNGNPSEAALVPLIDAAAAAGAEVFCIDAGWYDEDGGDWWPSVGEWRPSLNRFPTMGLDGVLDRIRERGMLPGIWVEPEVVGALSPVATQLPESAFLHRAGRRVVERERYFLDLADRAARGFLDEVFDRLIADHDIRFFKLDYNVTPGTGGDGRASGDGLLRHCRGYLEWFEALRARHPDVSFENCGSGAMRQDFAQLERFDLQSTSDQQDFRLYPPIAAGAPIMVDREQAGNWAYPQAEMSMEEIAFTMVTGLSGRLYLSGFLDRLDDDQAALVREGCRLYRERAQAMEASTAFWPCGLPGWSDDAVSLGWLTSDEVEVVVWWRGVTPTELELRLPVAVDARAPRIYPETLADWSIGQGSDASVLHVAMPAGPTARRFIFARSPQSTGQDAQA